jgi:hypothetical protein
MTQFDDTGVLMHGPIEQLAENLWRVEGALPNVTLRRTMTVARRDDGGLVIHSAIAMTDDAMRELEQLGTPSYLLVPNHWHRLDALTYKKRYPQLRVLGTAGCRAKIEKKISLDGTYEDFPADRAVRLDMLHGVADREGAMVVRSSDGVTIVLNDIVFNMDKKTDFMGWLLTTALGSAPGPRVSRLAKWTLVSDARALQRDLHAYAAMPDLVRVIVSHEKVTRDAESSRDALRRAATYLG